MLVRDNKYIHSQDKDFFILLRIGLWQKVEEELSPSPDWDYIYRLSTSQTVQGIIADGIGIYRKEHPELNITTEQNDRFVEASANIMFRNKAVNDLQSKLCQLFDDPSRLPELFPQSGTSSFPNSPVPSIPRSGDSFPNSLTPSFPHSLNPISYVVLKGQSVSQHYPKPMLRCPGDIDFFFDEENYERAITLVEQATGAIGTRANKRLHYQTKINKITVELHGPQVLNFGKRIRNVMQREFNRMMSTDNLPSYNCNGTTIHLATPEYNALYIFMHCLQHYYVSGLGLRQICDWAIYLHASLIPSLPSSIFLALTEMKLLHAWQVFFAFSTQWLGLPVQNAGTDSKCEALFSLNQEISPSSISSVWNAIKESGNMGHNKEDFRNQGFIRRNINTFRSFLKSSYNRHHLSPEIDNYMWFRQGKAYFQAIRNRLTSINK